jgi:hypothetical protein
MVAAPLPPPPCWWSHAWWSSSGKDDEDGPEAVGWKSTGREQQAGPPAQDLLSRITGSEIYICHGLEVMRRERGGGKKDR